jgi:hypothetical protein
MVNIMSYLLKVRTVEPLLVNGTETTFVSRQRFCKHGYNSGTVGNGVFYSVRAKGVIRKTTGVIETKRLKFGGGQAYDRSSD